MLLHLVCKECSGLITTEKNRIKCSAAAIMPSVVLCILVCGVVFKAVLNELFFKMQFVKNILVYICQVSSHLWGFYPYNSSSK